MTQDVTEEQTRVQAIINELSVQRNQALERAALLAADVVVLQQRLAKALEKPISKTNKKKEVVVP